MKKYYNIPINAKALIEKKTHPKSILRDSLKQNIFLILQTHFGEYRYDKSYGCMIWTRDYDTIESIGKWKDELRRLIQEAIQKYEKRLENINVAIEIDKMKFLDTEKTGPIRMKRRIIILIKGIIAESKTAFEHSEVMFFSPLSLS